MSWFPVDDAFHSHPKARKAGLEALGLWTVSGSYCMAYLTDGFVPSWFVKEKPRGQVLAKRLVAAGLWYASEKAGEDGFQFHDWKLECTKAYVEDVRAKARQRKAKSRETHRDVTVSVTRDGTRESLGWPTQPNPTQPINPLVTSSGGVTKVDARGPRPDCLDHEENSDGPCRACRRRREWDEANADRLSADELESQRRKRELIANCPDCHGTHWLTDADGNPTERCTHQAAAHG